MNRTIQFWQLTTADEKPLRSAFPVSKLFGEMIEAKAAGKNLEMSAHDGTRLHLEVHSYDGAEPFMILYRPRRNNEGHMNDNGTIRPMPFTDGQFVTEPTYVKFFPRNIVGFLYHNEGPRPKRFVEYVNSKFAAKLGMIPIYRKDLDAELRELSLQYLEVAVPASQAIGLTAQHDGSWAPALAAAGQILHDGSVVLRIAVGRGGTTKDRALRQQTILERAREFLGLPDHSVFAKAKVVGMTSRKRSTSLDLLRERFVHKISIEGEPFVPGQTLIRDDTRIIETQWKADETLLTAATTALASDAEDPGLLQPFREHGTNDAAEDVG